MQNQIFCSDEQRIISEAEKLIAKSYRPM